MYILLRGERGTKRKIFLSKFCSTVTYTVCTCSSYIRSYTQYNDILTVRFVYLRLKDEIRHFFFIFRIFSHHRAGFESYKPTAESKQVIAAKIVARTILL